MHYCFGASCDSSLPLHSLQIASGHLLTFILHHKPSAEDLMVLEDDWVWILAFPKQDLLTKNGIGKEMTPFSMTHNHPRNGGLGRKLLLMHRSLGNVCPPTVLLLQCHIDVFYKI